ncbi:Chaperone DnaJ [Gossypium australe]|uniref:Chaperone DnaJ n=1 Tax=Gossypium australe TaxID=47621 RepID=A0A5B6VRJ8_9ROSI|nr:Chaperone DnaJ [Gossypium australe]
MAADTFLTVIYVVIAEDPDHFIYNNGFHVPYLHLYGLISIHSNVEFNTKQSIDIEDIDEKLEGIDVNGFKSIPATYFSMEERNNISLELINVQPIEAWVDYNDGKKLLAVNLEPTTSIR